MMGVPKESITTFLAWFSKASTRKAQRPGLGAYTVLGRNSQKTGI